MPAQITFYADKSSEVIVESQLTPDGKSGAYIISSDLLSSRDDASSIGRLIINKVFATDLDGSIVADFTYTVKFSANSGLPSSPFSDVLVFNTKLYNNVLIPPASKNPTEIIQPGQTSVQLTGGVVTSQSSGEFCNQFGYAVKTKDLTNFRKYDVYFPQLVANYTNVFNSLPQPSVAPLA